MAVPKVGVVDGHAKGNAAEVEMIGRQNQMHCAGDVRAEAVREAMVLTENLMIRRDAVHHSSGFVQMSKQPRDAMVFQE